MKNPFTLSIDLLFFESYQVLFLPHLIEEVAYVLKLVTQIITLSATV